MQVNRYMDSPLHKVLKADKCIELIYRKGLRDEESSSSLFSGNRVENLLEANSGIAAKDDGCPYCC